MQQLQLSRQQLREVVDARRSLLQELQRVAAEWQKVLPTLALQLLQVRGLCACVLAVSRLEMRWRDSADAEDTAAAVLPACTPAAVSYTF
jgi:hypothetical protein